MPTIRALPASTASGRSVSWRSTSTGLPKLGASSWMPPESVRSRVGSGQDAEQFEILKWLTERDPFLTAQLLLHQPAHDRVEMHREQEGDIRRTGRAGPAPPDKLREAIVPGSLRRWAVTEDKAA